MMPVFMPIVATLLLGQAQPDRTATGDVVDDLGNPVAGARVVLHSPPVQYGKGDPVEAETTSDAQGKFSLKTPPLGRIVVNGVNYLAYCAGLGNLGSAVRQAAVSPGPGKAQAANGVGSRLRRQADCRRRHRRHG